MCDQNERISNFMIAKTEGFPIVGSFFEWEYKHNGITLEMAGNVQKISDKTITLNDIMIFTANGIRAELGTGVMKMIVEEFKNDLFALGFQRAEIFGKRITGATKGREVNLTIDCQLLS